MLLVQSEIPDSTANTIRIFLFSVFLYHRLIILFKVKQYIIYLSFLLNEIPRICLRPHNRGCRRNQDDQIVQRLFQIDFTAHFQLAGLRRYVDRYSIETFQLFKHIG